MGFVLVEFAVEDNTKLLYILKYLHIVDKIVAFTIGIRQSAVTILS
jgi:hypothetical protein